MLVSREELEFDFQGAKFNLNLESDRKLLIWIFNQFLYGEVTGIQCGYWLYRAPSIHSAQFLAKQASEELSHFRRFLRILRLLNGRPKRAHWAIRFLSTGMMGHDWAEHVSMEMAVGEGLVLGVFYALISTIPDLEIKKILESAVMEEERHVEFGETETLKLLRKDPKIQKKIELHAGFQLWFLILIKKHILKSVAKEVSNAGLDHPVLSQFSRVYDHWLDRMELRVQRIQKAGGIDGRYVESFRKVRNGRIVTAVILLMTLIFHWLSSRLQTLIISILPWKTSHRLLLTDTYLNDPFCRDEFEKVDVAQQVE